MPSELPHPQLLGFDAGHFERLGLLGQQHGFADDQRSQQGSLRQFIKNSNAITGVNTSRFQIPGP